MPDSKAPLGSHKNFRLSETDEKILQAIVKELKANSPVHTSISEADAIRHLMFTNPLWVKHSKKH